MIYSMLKNGTLFTVENEQEQVAAYYARKHLPVIGMYNQIRQSCRDYPAIKAKTKSIHPNELGVIKFLQKGAWQES